MIYDEERKCQHLGNCSKPVCPALGRIFCFSSLSSQTMSRNGALLAEGNLYNSDINSFPNYSSSSIMLRLEHWLWPPKRKTRNRFNLTFLLFLTLLGVSSAIFLLSDWLFIIGVMRELELPHNWMSRMDIDNLPQKSNIDLFANARPVRLLPRDSIKWISL